MERVQLLCQGAGDEGDSGGDGEGHEVAVQGGQQETVDKAGVVYEDTKM
ncbi:hypothetical protein [Streptomyces werraensis]